MTPEEQKQYVEPKDKRSIREKHFDELYAAFYAYYTEAVKTADAPHAKVYLQLTTVFFDDLNLQKVVQPLFGKYTTNVEEKRAVARAAYWDAIMIHNRTAGLSFVTVPEKEKNKFLQESK